MFSVKTSLEKSVETLRIKKVKKLMFTNVHKCPQMSTNVH